MECCISSKTLRGLPVAAVILTLAMLAVACGSGAPPGELAPSPAPTVTPTPAPDAVAVLASTVANLRAAESMRYDFSHDPGSTFITSVTAKVTDTSGVWDVEQGAAATIEAALVSGPDAGLESGTFISMDLVVTRDDYFITNPLSGEWVRLPLSALTVRIDEIPGEVADILAGIQEPALSGPESLDGLETYKITGRAAAGSAGKLVDVELWTDTAELLPRKILVSGAFLAYDRPDTVRKMLLANFNEEVTIEAPTEFADMTGRP